MHHPTVKLLRTLMMLFAFAFVWACDGDDGAAGPPGPGGPVGPPGPPGPPAPPTGTGIIIGDGSGLTAAEIETLGQLDATITGVTVSSPPVVDFTVVDANGNPAEGLEPGVVQFTFAKLVPGDPDFNGGLPYWQSYINRTANSSRPGGLATAIQATTDSAGTLEELGGGQYRYTFSRDVTDIQDPIPVEWQPSLTHRVGLEIRLGGPGEVPLAPFNPTFDFVPDGGAGSGVTKAIADLDNCADCHNEFAMHGGPRKSVDYCVTCHNPLSIDPDSAESVDMAYMAHSIHRGENRATPYIIYGFGGSEHNYGEVTYPQSVTYCETCHEASASHPDGNAWNEGANAKACGGCHADGLVTQNFDAVTGIPEYAFDHAVADAPIGLVQDGECVACHLGTIQSAGPPLAIHSKIRGDARARAEAGENFVYEILDATNTAPGETPVVTFLITDPAGDPYDIFTDPQFTDSNASLNLYVQWSTDDYYGGNEDGLVLGARQNDALDIQAIQDLEFRDTGYPYRMFLGAIRDAITNGGGSANADGSYTVPFFQPLPLAISGDVAVGLAGHPAWEYTDADGVTAFDRAAAVSAVFFPGEPRQTAVTGENCNACHELLQLHGGNRNGNPEICLFCHNGDAAVCADPVLPDGSCPTESAGFHFGYMIHSIHSASPTYLGGEFAGVTYPQSLENCEACHTPGSFNAARDTARSVSTEMGDDIRVWTDDMATTANAANCGVCHTTPSAVGHMSTQGAQIDELKCNVVGAGCGAMDGSSGTGLPNGQEACEVCHGSGAEFETALFHDPRAQE